MTDDKKMVGSQTVLVVEDNPVNMKLAETILEDAGYTVLQAESAEEGLALASTQRPAAVLMDIQLPEMDGIEALKRLRGDPRTRGLKIVAVTTLAMTGDREEILAAGFDGYVSKPFKVQQLLDTVQAVMS